MSWSIDTTLFQLSRLSVSVSEGTIDGQSRITERWFVAKKPVAGVITPFVLPYDIDALRADVTGTTPPPIPNIGTPYPDGPGSTAEHWQTYALLRSANWEHASGGASCTLEYTTRYFWTKVAKGMAPGSEVLANATKQDEGAFLHASVTPTIRTRSMQQLRDNPSMTAPNASNDKSGTDIDGDPKRKSTDVRQVALRLRLVIDCESAGIDELTGIIQAYVGKKNTAQFLGYGAGQLVCDGGSISQLEFEFFEIVMDYVWDEYYHHSQVPEVGADGRALMIGADYADVRWAREVRSGVNFNDIWPIAPLGQSYKYQAYKGVWY
jgi:hypothetical protein